MPTRTSASARRRTVPNERGPEARMQHLRKCPVAALESPPGGHYPFLTGELRSSMRLLSPLCPQLFTHLMPSFVRGIFAGALHDELLFPYPPPLERRDPAEARLVR